MASRDPDGRPGRAWGVILAAGLLSGCPAAQADRTAQPDTRPVRGGVLRLQVEVPSSLDPLRAESVYESLPVRQIFDGLVATDPGMNLVPALASTWTISRDNRTYTFHLREDVRFHDGTPLTARDAVFTLERALSRADPWNLVHPYLAVIRGAEEFASGRSRRLAGVEAVDPRTVRIELVRPYLSFLEVLTMDGLRVVPEHAVRAARPDFARAPVGTGPFRLRSWDARHLVLERNPGYWGGEPWLDALDAVFPSGEGQQETDRLLAGEVDVAQVTGDVVGRLSGPDVRVLRFQEMSVAFLGLLTGDPTLDDVRVRQAIAHAIDREALVDDAPLLRREAVGILPPGLPGYSPDRKALPHDPARARALLAAAGYPGGRGMRALRLYTSGSSAAATRVLAAIDRDLEAVGIPCEVRVVGWGEMSRKIQDHDAPAFMLGWVADLADPDAFLRALFQSDATSNLFAFDDPAADALLERGAREMHPVQRVRIYREAERRILEMAPLVPLYHSVGVLATRPWVHGVEPGPMGLSAIPFHRVWLGPPGGRR